MGGASREKEYHTTPLEIKVGKMKGWIVLDILDGSIKNRTLWVVHPRHPRSEYFTIYIQ